MINEAPDFRLLCSRAGLTAPEVAKHFNATLDTVNSWSAGLAKPPQWVKKTLGIMADFAASPFGDSLDMVCQIELGDVAQKQENTQMSASPKKARDIRVLSFFTGGGGLDLGFEEAGFTIIRASDIDRPSCKTLALNQGGLLPADLTIVCEDVRRTSLAELPSNIDLIIGGPPCQSFSASGRRAGGAAGRLDQRGNLFRAYCDIVESVRPRAFVFENVRGILSTNGGDDWRTIVAAFGALGYKLTYRLLDALDFGVPQQRERMFLVGTKCDVPFLFPRPTHGPDSPGNAPYVTASEALHGINEDEDIEPLKMIDGKYAHLLSEVPVGQNYLYFTAKRGYPKPIFAYRSRFSDFLYKADPDQPVKTLIAKPGKYTGPFHWNNRCFTIKEYKRLQGFPDGYQFYGSRDEVVRQIGNSVSPKIAKYVALAVLRQVFGVDVDVALLPNDHVLSFDRRKGAKASQTKKMHARVAAQQTDLDEGHFTPISYLGDVKASHCAGRIYAELNADRTTLTVSVPGSKKLFAEFEFRIVKRSSVPHGRTAKPSAEYVHVVHVRGFGSGDEMPQLMWNAVDDWVQRTSHYHSLFELYGHFTEPYPLFEIAEFKRFDSSAMARIMEFCADLGNCSRYLPKERLKAVVPTASGWGEFCDVARKLRAVRFDIRSKETNIAIAPNDFIIAYPFTLPNRRQMNFSVRTLVDEPAEIAA